MAGRTRRCGPAALALAAAAGVLVACSGGPAGQEAGPSPATPPAEPVTITVSDRGVPGTLWELVAEYDRDHPEVVVELALTDPQVSSYRTPLSAQLTGTARLPDVIGFSDAEAGLVQAHAERFVDLRDHGFAARVDDVHPWASSGATDPDGRLLGFPADIGPEALCFRADLLAQAGVAADGAELAAALAAAGGGWDAYLELGRGYHAATGRAWFDSAATVWEAMVRQLPTGYSATDGSRLGVQDPQLRARWDLLVAAVDDGLSAREAQWDWRGGQAFVDGSFATMPCASWMTGVVAANLEAAGGGPQTGWAVADAFPGGAGSWGTSYLAVTADSPHPAVAARLVDWLTRPEQQARAYAPTGPLPSTHEAIAQVAAAAAPSETFGGVVLEAVFAARAQGVPAHVTGVLDAEHGLAFGAALHDLEAGTVASEEAWVRAAAGVLDLLDD